MPAPLSPLQTTIKSFEVAAAEYHALRKKNITGPDQAKQREDLDEELRKRLTSLEARYRQLSVEADLAGQIENQKKLANYSAGNNEALLLGEDTKDAREAAIERMRTEAHHPTDTLWKHMAAVGDVAPDDNCSPHHIVMGVGKKESHPVTKKLVPTKNSIQARAKLHMLGLGINAPENGVWLPKSRTYVPHWAFPAALPHANIHTLLYEAYVMGKIGHLDNQQALTSALRNIATVLQKGENISFMNKDKQDLYLENMLAVR